MDASLRGRLLAIVFTFALAVVGCTSDATMSGAGPSTARVPLVLTFTAEDRPQADARVGTATSDAVVGSHCWTSDGAGTCVDTVLLTVAQIRPLLEVARGTPLIVSGSARNVGCMVMTLPPEQELIARLPLTDARGVIDVGPGRYTLECIAKWDEGRVPFTFGINVV